MLRKMAAALAGIVVAVFAAAALYIYDSGFATVQIREGHSSFTVPVPLAFVEVGLLFISASHQNRLPEPLVYCREVLPAVLTELEETTDVTFVDVVNGKDSVQVQKAGSNLIVQVESLNEKVRVKAPVRSLTRILRRVLAVHSAHPEKTSPVALKF